MTDKYEIDFVNIINIFIKKRYYILISILIFIFIGIYNLSSATYKYRVQLQIFPVKENNSLSLVNTSFSLTSVLRGSSSTNLRVGKFELYKAVFHSKLLANEILKDIDLMKTVFPGEWDIENQKWKKPELSRLSNFKNAIKEFINMPIYYPSEPNEERVYNILKEFRFDTNDDNQLTTVYVDTDRPEVYKILLEKLNLTADKILRKKQIERTTSHINFVSELLPKTKQTNQRLSLIQTLTQQQKQLMLASSNLPYSAEIFSDIFQQEKHVSPIARNFLFIYLLFGTFIGLIVALILNHFDKRK